MEEPGFGRRGAGLRRLSGSVLLTAALLGSAGLATACGQSGSGAIASLSPGKAASLIPSKSAGITPSAAASASTGVTSSVSAAASPSAQNSAQSSAPQTPAAQAPAARTSAPQPTATVAPAAHGSGSSLLWLWILIAVIVVGGGIALIAYSARRRSAAAADWRTRVIDVYAEGQALHDAIWTSPWRGQSADGAASPRSSGIELRADNLTQDLYALRESAPDEAQHARIVDVLVALQAVRSAMAAHADLEGRLASFQTALRGLRASADPSSSSPGFAGSV